MDYPLVKLYRKRPKTHREILEKIEQSFKERQKQQSLLDLVSDISALMVMRKCQNPLGHPRLCHWSIELQDFKGKASWLLSDGKGRVFFKLNIEQLLADAYVRQHSKIVDAILNERNNIRSSWNDLFHMLSRPITIRHPHTKEPLLVQIDMNYNSERSQTCSDGSIYLDVTFRKRDSQLTPKFQQGRANKAHFGSLLSENNNHQPSIQRMELDSTGQEATNDDGLRLPGQLDCSDESLRFGR